MEPVVFTGLSGFKYNYFVWVPYPGWAWLPFPGNYCFARVVGLVTPLYFGEAENLHTRPMPPMHERWDEAVAVYGATHLLTHLALASDSVRKGEERDLIAAYNPPMNVQHRTAPAGQRGISPLEGALAHALRGRRGIG
jgi:hypothetical protein